MKSISYPSSSIPSAPLRFPPLSGNTCYANIGSQKIVSWSLPGESPMYCEVKYGNFEPDSAAVQWPGGIHFPAGTTAIHNFTDHNYSYDTYPSACQIFENFISENYTEPENFKRGWRDNAGRIFLNQNLTAYTPSAYVDPSIGFVMKNVGIFPLYAMPILDQRMSGVGVNTGGTYPTPDSASVSMHLHMENVSAGYTPSFQLNSTGGEYWWSAPNTYSRRISFKGDNYLNWSRPTMSPNTKWGFRDVAFIDTPSLYLDIVTEDDTDYRQFQKDFVIHCSGTDNTVVLKNNSAYPLYLSNAAYFVLDNVKLADGSDFYISVSSSRTVPAVKLENGSTSGGIHISYH